jgi:hypothetical protein
VKRTYDALLRRREGEPFGRELQRSDMRFQMMQAMLEVAPPPARVFWFYTEVWRSLAQRTTLYNPSAYQDNL